MALKHEEEFKHRVIYNDTYVEKSNLGQEKPLWELESDLFHN